MSGDNTSIISLSKYIVHQSRAKHVYIKHHFIRYHVERGVFLLKFTPIFLQNFCMKIDSILRDKLNIKKFQNYLFPVVFTPHLMFCLKSFYYLSCQNFHPHICHYCSWVYYTSFLEKSHFPLRFLFIISFLVYMNLFILTGLSFLLFNYLFHPPSVHLHPSPNHDRAHSMVSQKISLHDSSLEIDFLSLDSSEVESSVHFSSSKRWPPPSKRKNPKIPIVVLRTLLCR